MPTLTTSLILQDIMGAFKVRTPMLAAMSTNFTNELLKLNGTATAHIRTLPTAANYDASTGYANGATEGRSLLVDVPITIDSHKHVPIEMSHLYAIQDQKESYQGAIADQAYVLGKTMVDSVLAKAKSANFSYGKSETTSNVDLTTLNEITTQMNKNGAAAVGRVGIVNSDVMGNLFEDSRITSRDYYAQMPDGTGLRMLRGVGGFGSIYEYPDLPANNATGQTFERTSGNILTATAHGFLTGDRVRVSTSAADLPAGLSVDTTYYVIKLTANTFSLATTDANATAGTAITLSDAGTGTHTVTGYENITGIFFERRAFALKAGLPLETSAIAAALGIPALMTGEVMTDPDSGFSMMLMKWQQVGTGDLFISPTSIWGSAAGRQAGATGAITDKAAVLLRSA